MSMHPPTWPIDREYAAQYEAAKSDPGLEGMPEDGNPDDWYELMELLAAYDKSDEGVDNPITAMEERDMAAGPLIEAFRKWLHLEKDEEYIKHVESGHGHSS